MRKFLWIGSYLNEEIFREYQKIGYKNAASYLSQKNIIEGLKWITSQNFDTLNMISMKGYPFDKRIKIRNKLFESEQSKNIVIGYYNLLYLNKYLGRLNLEKAANIWIKDNYQNITEGLDIFVYEMRSACLNAAVVIKNAIPDTKIHLIVPDLPMFMDLKMNMVKKILKKLDWINIKSKLPYVDDYILYSEYMAQFLKVKNNNWLLMEGSINVNDMSLESINTENDNDKFVVMYSGTIDKNYGVLALIDAFELLNNDYELWITGGGKDAEEVKKLANKYKNVKFFGFLLDRKDLLHLQQKATVFINIRNPNIAASNYCFPSKLFEYMLTGKPVITCKLGGIPQEYYKYLIKFDTLESERIAEVIKKVATLSKNERDTIGQKGKFFIIENKNNYVQAKRIINFIKDRK